MATPRPLYAHMSSLIAAMANCKKANNQEWWEKHRDRLIVLTRARMPSGSGIDSGTMLDLDRSTPEKLVFTTAFHHMNNDGFYDGWTDHKVLVTPSLAHGFNLHITGRDRNQIKDYLYEVFSHDLHQEIDMDAFVKSTEPA
jgi:hypothetical protein